MKVDPRLHLISPFWARKLERIRGISGLKKKYYLPNLSDSIMKMDSFGCCVVGEAYGFNHNYQKGFRQECKQCEIFANGFNVYDGDTTPKVIDRFERLIVQFCNHVERKHGIKLKEVLQT